MVSLAEVVVIAGLAGAATGLGALPVFVTDRISHRFYDAAVGLAAGIMFGAAVFALVVPGLEVGSLSEVVAGVLLGAVFLLVANRLVPHVHLLISEEVEADGQTYPETAAEETVEADEITLESGSTRASEPDESDVGGGTGADSEGSNGSEGGKGSDDSDDPTENRRRALLVGSAITIHNVPEGLAIGIAFAGGLEGVGIALAIAIAIQNVPDGFAMAVPASRTGLSNAKTVLYTTLSGAVPEPIAAAAGFALVAVVTGIFPLAAGFAAGTMIAVIFRELIPASHGHGYADIATLTFVVGFTVMLVVDVGLAV
ncbi:ZIP family metal transporter [Natronolimnohabitans innermongolicus]|uniref:Zinc/iron permease n=1 Tax=Natronolimnohabitans innermongolicus JCM 12255 TaxID=1227499 RepID=L9WGX3_9EURY|nr:ZIP family metal transporter [Natronolimnohabitans innermongolicus]ELY48770.1 zinc/iron permease [Natronolimnohabitans innermongolicus JCM 12255]